jgi:hypothetical protein
MPPDAIKIVKMGGSAPPPPQAAAARKASRPVARPVKKTMRTYPRGVLKLKGGSLKPVADPAKSPPTRKNTLRILTDKGVATRRKTIHDRVKKMSDRSIRETLRRSGLPISDKTPPHIVKEILEGGMEAGMIVSP